MGERVPRKNTVQQQKHSIDSLTQAYDGKIIRTEEGLKHLIGDHKGQICVLPFDINSAGAANIHIGEKAVNDYFKKVKENFAKAIGEDHTVELIRTGGDEFLAVVLINSNTATPKQFPSLAEIESSLEDNAKKFLSTLSNKDAVAALQLCAEKRAKAGDVLLNFKRFLIRQELPDNHKQKYTDVINATRSALRTNGDSEAFASALFKLSQHITKNIESSTADPHYKSKTPLSVRVEGAFVSTTVFTYPNKLIRILDHLNYRSENPNITSKRILIGPHAASRRQDDAKFLENDAVNYSAPKLVLKDGSEIQMKRFENLTEDDKRSIQTDQTSTRVVLNVPAFGVLNHGIGTARANKFLVTLLRSIYEDVIPGHFRTDIPIAFSGGNIEISVKKEYFDIATLEEFSNKCSKVAFNSLINIIRRPNDEKWINGSSRFIKTMASIYLELQVKQFLKGESEVTPYSAYPKVEATLSS